MLIDYVDLIRRDPPSPEEKIWMEKVYQELKILSKRYPMRVLTAKDFTTRRQGYETPIFFLG